MNTNLDIVTLGSNPEALASREPFVVNQAHSGYLDPRVLDTSKIATLTGKAIQDDETFKSEGGFVPERDQFYFEMKQGDNVFLVGFKDLLISLKLMEQMQEIPKISGKWWSQIATLYGWDLQMLELEDKQ